MPGFGIPGAMRFDFGYQIIADALQCCIDASRRWLVGHVVVGTFGKCIESGFCPAFGQRTDMMTGSFGYSLRISTSVEIPSISGISISKVIKSGFSCGIFASAIFP